VNFSEEIIMSAIWLATIENTHMARYGSDEYVPFYQTTNEWKCISITGEVVQVNQ
jgi:hypothetical protein